jgi:subtilisin family serine protease
LRPLLVASIVAATLAGTAVPGRDARAQQIAPRVSLVLRGHLLPASIGDGRDELAVVTARLPGGAAALRTLGFDARPLGGDVAGLRLSRSELQRLARVPGLAQLDERRLLHPLLDQAAGLVGAPGARMESGLDGSGVLVGIVDTGADVRHADLRGADGSTHVETLLDLSLTDDGRHDADVGNFGGKIWTRDDIDAALDAEAAGMSPAVPLDTKDTAGHGTHVAGIVGSTGLATGNSLPAGRYVGIAPGAHLVTAKAARTGNQFTDDDVLTACRFTVARAQALGLPMVVNLSIGGGGGAHDGSSNLEQALDALFPVDQPGLALVAAAGNEGLTDRHAAGATLSGSTEIPVQIDRSAATSGEVAIDLYASRPVSISIISPSGRVLGPIKAGDSNQADLGDEGTAAIDHTPAVRSDGRQQSGLIIAGPVGSGVPAGGTWRIRVAGTQARWDLWITETPGNFDVARFSDHISEDDRLALPGTAQSAISVASFVSRSGWTDLAGEVIDRGLIVGEPSLFSAPGPSADGRFVPDLAAPGEFIISSLSADAHPDQSTSDFFVGPSDPDFAWADDGQHGVLRGTSQAAPFVAGTAALLFQADPTLTGTQVRELLRASARDSGAGWSERLGFGALDVQAALDLTRGQWGTSVDAGRSSVGVSLDALPPGEGITTVSVTPRDSTGRAVGPGRSVDISVSAGEPAGPVVDAGEGRYQRAIVAHATRGQIGVVSATVDGLALSAHPNIYYVWSRDEIGRQFSAGGGCTPFGPPGGGLFLVVATVLFATFLAGRRSKRLRG